MATTDLHKYTVVEKLNKMDVDLIDITVRPDADNGAAMTAGDFMFPIVEIPNAVAVDGGTAILQSCCAVISGGDGDGADTGAFDIVITNDSTVLQHGGADINTDDDMASVTSALSIMDGTCGFFSITNAFDAGVVAIGDKRNIGMVCKAAAGSKSLYAYGIVQNTADYNEGSIVLRLGFVKD
tara:strand:+ start:211 stop:756 length:546 start_codon:yes stop_codon:yes gene_type:complete